MSTLTAASACVLGLAPLPLARGLLDAEFRRLFPRHSAAMAVGLVSWWCAIAIGAVTAPLAVQWGALALIVLVSSVGWWARTSAGARGGLPPGDRSLGRSVRDLARRDAYLQRFARLGPVTKAVQFTGTVACIQGLERGQRLLREHRVAIGPSPLAFTQHIMGGFLRYMDDATHDVYGPLFRRAMSRAVTDSAIGNVTITAPRLLHEAAVQGADPSAALAEIAYGSLLFALFGIDESSSFHDEFTRQYRTFAGSAIAHPGRKRTANALGELRLMARRFNHTGDDGHPACAIREMRRLDPSMPDDTCIDNLIFMLRIGADNVAGLMRWMLQFLAENPRLREHLCELASAADSRLDEELEAFVNECLRNSQSEYVYRRLTDDVVFDGFTLKKGWRVRICVWESHRDASIFDDADEFTNRFVGHRFPSSQFCPFGFDRHACNGGGVSMGIATAVLHHVVSHPEWVLHPATRTTRGFRHWSHWRPGPDLRITSSRP